VVIFPLLAASKFPFTTITPLTVILLLLLRKKLFLTNTLPLGPIVALSSSPNVKFLTLNNPGPLIVSKEPSGWLVVKSPVTFKVVPLATVIVPFAVLVKLPVMVGDAVPELLSVPFTVIFPVKLAPNVKVPPVLMVTLVAAAALDTVMVCPLRIVTTSLAIGIPEGLQVPALFQTPVPLLE